MYLNRGGNAFKAVAPSVNVFNYLADDDVER
jgi:hypothetical protein